jgi:hypothetical protein
VTRLARQEDKHGLSDFLRKLRFSHLAQFGGMHQTNIAGHEGAEGRLRILADVLLQ